MSVHPVPVIPGDYAAIITPDMIADIRKLCRLYIRTPEGQTDSALIFTPDLTPTEVAKFARIVAFASIMRITPQEFDAIQSDIDGLTTYQGLANPTLAQTVQAVKAQNRIWKALLRS